MWRTVGVLVVLFMASRNRKYLGYAWTAFRVALAFVLLVLVAFALQRIAILR